MNNYDVNAANGSTSSGDGSEESLNYSMVDTEAAPQGNPLDADGGDGGGTKRSYGRLWRGCGFVLLCGIILGVVVYSPLFTLKNIIVTGNNTLSQEEICQIARVAPGQMYFQIRTDEMTRYLQGDLRLDSAVVRRRFPDTLEISVSERRPLATLSCEYGYVDVDRYGMIMDCYKTLKHMSIPIINGIRLQDVYVGDTVNNPSVEQLLEYLSLLDSDSLNQISEITAVQPDYVIAYTNNAVQIRLGHLERIEEKAQLTRGFLKDLQTSSHPIEYVDFNYKAPFIKLKTAK